MGERGRSGSGEERREGRRTLHGRLWSRARAAACSASGNGTPPRGGSGSGCGSSGPEPRPPSPSLDDRASLNRTAGASITPGSTRNSTATRSTNPVPPAITPDSYPATRIPTSTGGVSSKATRRAAKCERRSSEHAYAVTMSTTMRHSHAIPRPGSIRIRSRGYTHTRGSRSTTRPPDVDRTNALDQWEARTAGSRRRTPPRPSRR